FPGLYAARWEAEILFDAVKTELRGGTTVRFRSQSPDLVRQEAWALLLVYQALSDLITRAAGYRQLDPDRVSFTTALNTARRSVNSTGRRFPPEYLAALDGWAFSELMDDLLPARRCRWAPREVTLRSFRFATRKPGTPASGRTRHRIHIWRLDPPVKTPSNNGVGTCPARDPRRRPRSRAFFHAAGVPWAWVWAAVIICWASSGLVAKSTRSGTPAAWRCWGSWVQARGR